MKNLLDIRGEIPYFQLGDTYIYKAHSGVVVTSCCAPEAEFKTIFHYLRFSYGAWGSKIYKAVKLDWTEKLQRWGIVKTS